MNITFQDFLAFCKSLPDVTLKTRGRKKSFTVKVIETDLYFHIESTGKTRVHTKEYIEKVHQRFNESQSFTTSEYHDITVNASYHLTLIGLYFDSKRRNAEPIPTQEFISFCKTLSGETIITISRGSRFSVTVSDSGLHFHLEANRKTRNHTLAYVEKVLQRFNETRSLSPSDYPMTVNASYQVALIDLYLKNKNAVKR